jgi:hypothetical protein
VWDGQGQKGGGAKAPFPPVCPCPSHTPSHLTRVEMDRICVEIQYVNQCPNISEYAMKGWHQHNISDIQQEIKLTPRQGKLRTRGVEHVSYIHKCTNKRRTRQHIRRKYKKLQASSKAKRTSTSKACEARDTYKCQGKRTLSDIDEARHKVKDHLPKDNSSSDPSPPRSQNNKTRTRYDTPDQTA